MTHVTCRLTAKNRDQLRNPTLGNRVWATFTFFSSFYALLKLTVHFPVSKLYDTIRYDTRCYFSVRSKADINQLNLLHRTKLKKVEKRKIKKSKNRICPEASVNSSLNPWSQPGRRNGRLRWEGLAGKEGLSLEWEWRGDKCTVRVCRLLTYR